jgi:hypothetical protein
MSGVATAIVAGSVITGYMGSQAAQNAAQTQANAAQAGQAQLQANFNALQPNYTPYMGVGTNAINTLNANQPYFTNQFSNADLNANLAPNFAFGLDIGQRSLANQANATGGVVGGNAQTALAQFNNNYAQNAYQQAFNNYQAQRQNIFGNVMNQIGVGQNAVSALGNLSSGVATNVAQLGVAGANANAAGQIGSANAISGAVGNATNGILLSNLLAGGGTGNTGVTPTGGSYVNSLPSLNYTVPTIPGQS